MKRLLQDPLIIFLLIGGGIFLLYARLNPSDEMVEANPNRIDVTNDIQNLLVSEWSARWNRPPTTAEFKGLLDGHVKEEILFREATKLGLDQSDSIIRRRLAQKMEFLTSDIANLEDVSDETLQTFLDENPDKFREPVELAFRQIYFSTDKRENPTEDAGALLAKLNDGSMSFEQALDASDRTLLRAEFQLTPLDIIGRELGGDFSNAVSDEKPGDWIGPVKSGYGFHLVKVLDRKNSQLPELATIRKDLLTDYRYKQREKLNESMLNALLEQYEVVIATREEEPAGTKDDTKQ